MSGETKESNDVQLQFTEERRGSKDIPEKFTKIHEDFLKGRLATSAKTHTGPATVTHEPKKETGLIYKLPRH